MKLGSTSLLAPVIGLLGLWCNAALADDSLSLTLGPDHNTQLHLVGATNESYALQSADDLSASNPWTTFLTGTTDGSGAFAATDAPPAGTTKRFYRAVRVSRALQATTTSAVAALNQKTSITLTGTDLLNPSAALIYTVLTLPAQGTLCQWDGTAITAPNTPVTDSAHRVYLDNGNRGNPYTTFTYGVSEPNIRGSIPSQPTTVSISIIGPPTPTTPAPQVNENSHVRFQLTAIDPEYPGSTAFTFTVIGPPSGGTLYQVNADNLTVGAAILSNVVTVTNPIGYLIYVPNGDVYGNADSFSYTVTSKISGQQSDYTVVSLDVAHVNQPPTVRADTITGTNNNPSIPFSLLWYDPDPGDTITYYFTALPARGTITLDDGTPVVVGQGYSEPYGSLLNFNFQHAPYDYGNPYATFSYYVRDAAGATSATVTDTLVITYVNGQPVSTTPTSVTLLHDTSAKIQISGTDPDNDGLRFFITTAPTHGKLYITYSGINYDVSLYLPLEIQTESGLGFPSVTYVPNAGYSNDNLRADTFGYRLQDTHVPPASVDGTVALIVNSKPQQ